MREWILKKYDWFIYRHAYRSINRICIRNPAYAYLLSKHIEDWLYEFPIDEATRQSVDKHHAECRDQIYMEKQK